MIALAQIDAEGIECAPDSLQRRLLAQPHARPQRDNVAERVIDGAKCRLAL
jgi:hypothetical protein